MRGAAACGAIERVSGRLRCPRSSCCARCPRECRGRQRRVDRLARCRGSPPELRSLPPPGRRARFRCTAACAARSGDMEESRVLISRIDAAGTISPSTARRSYCGRSRWRLASVVTVPLVPSRRRSGACRPRDPPGKGREALAHDAAHLSVARVPLLGGTFHLAAGLGQRYDPPGHALPVDYLRHRPALLDQHEFGRAAADIEDHCRPGALFQQDVAAEHGQSRFFPGRNHVQHDAGFAPHPFDEFIAILGPAAGFGCDRAGKADIAAAQFLGADLSALSARSIASSLSRPVCARPSPSRTTRLKASITVKLGPEGLAMSSRQLLVPRSIAA